MIFCQNQSLSARIAMGKEVLMDSTTSTGRSGALSGRVAFVLGASRGIGAGAAHALAAAGAKVVAVARDEQALSAVVNRIRSEGGEAVAFPADAEDAAQVQAAVEAAAKTYGHLDIAFNNAGSGHRPTPFADLTLEDFDRSIGVNLRGLLVAMKHELTAMLAGGRGAIVNMSSTAGVSGVRGMGAYCATKHAIVGATKSAALDYAGKGIRVNAVAPGPILTDRIRALSEAHRAPILAAVPLGRVGTVEEVAATVVWLCSDAASFITGAVIPIDGGRLAAGA
jgi:NAD(P)-dependent dehydrogenase (short-subunit alcohol dehydrogenase family)